MKGNIVDMYFGLCSLLCSCCLSILKKMMNCVPNYVKNFDDFVEQMNFADFGEKKTLNFDDELLNLDYL